MTNKTIVKNEVILPKHDDTYQEVRHIVLKGSDVEIGKALGDIARLEYRVSEPFPYADAIYARAHREYIKDNYPILFERMKGVARSYGLAEDDESHNTSCLLYFLTKPGCSVVFFPPEFTTTGHPLVSRTTEFYTAWNTARGRIPSAILIRRGGRATGQPVPLLSELHHGVVS